MLEEKTIFITGSSRGIGAATARLAKKYGARVILHGKTKSRHLEQLAKELDAKHYSCDATDPQAVMAVVQQAMADHGKIDILVNSAGVSNRAKFLETTDDIWLDMFKGNILSTVYFCRAIIPYMQTAKSGRIVNIASIRAYGVTSGRPAYSAAKAGIVNLTVTLAKELAPTIAVNAVAPGFTETDMSKTWDEEVWRQIKTSLAGRVGQPREIAEAILFLASDRASYITGQTLIVDGGYSVSGK